MRLYYFCTLLLMMLALGTYGQQGDSKYLEDQFYVGATYNLLTDKPDNVSQRNLSYGVMAGFIKDIPISPQRNTGFGIGLGYALNTYYSNIKSEEVDGQRAYSVIGPDEGYKRSKFATHLVEVPVQFRWRTSNAVDYKFWRIYTGMTMGYVFSGRSKFVGELEKDIVSNPDFEKFQYGLTLDFGYNTFNIHVYYALNGLFQKDIVLEDGNALGLKPLRVGLIFYIL